ncbi:LCP family protein [Nocardioides agariphilus]|uniref:LCP family protein n=1 Tax=Nocardioides agariphilus TaxID=433664 RepID=A0A930VNQ4_9ACTN|nr:LCP family protein [Nocardioides agariphilus]MBF4768110.1 LCP family protein [Nocardioides agariphilus]
MPPAPDPFATSPRASIRERAARVRYRRALMLMAMTLVVPGSAQLAAGNRQVGRVAMRIWLALVTFGVASVMIGFLSHEYVFWLASDTALLQLLRFVLMGLAVGWAYLLVDAWRLGQPLSLSLTHRRAVVGLNGVLCLSVAGTLLFGAHLVGVQRDFILTMFAGDHVSSANHGRFNVLLLGGDSGAGRWGLRPDSMTIASIDEETGRTVLVGLPRNMANFPFAKGSVMAKQFPKGFDCDGCYLNGVSTWAEDHTGLFGKSKHPGVDATIMAIEGITGLRINYWAMVNLQGFRDLVDAVGGVTLNVRQPIPVGGLGSDVTGYIKPGKRKLDGHDVLWFARSREGSDDYSRMARQKCVMSAMLSQVSPQTAVTNFEAIANASSAMISTNIPASEVDRFISLALQARGQKISTVSLVPPMVITAHPDIKTVRKMVNGAIARAEGRKPSAQPKPDASDASGTPAESPTPPAVVTGGSVGTLSDGYAANQSDDLGASC